MLITMDGENDHPSKKKKEAVKNERKKGGKGQKPSDQPEESSRGAELMDIPASE